MTRRTTAALTLVCALVGCAQGPEVDTELGTTTGTTEGTGSTSEVTDELGSSLVAGRLVDLAGEPVVNAIVTVSDEYCVPDRTSNDGEFSVERVTDGAQRVITYGETASNGMFASVVFPVTVMGDTTVQGSVRVPRLDERHPVDLEADGLQTIVSSTGLELDIEPGVLTVAPFFPHEILVARVPVADAPPIVPAGVELIDLHVLHPIRSTFEPPAPLRAPVSPAMPPGTAVTFHALDYETGLLSPVASGTINDEGVAVTNPGEGIPELTWIGLALAE